MKLMKNLGEKLKAAREAMGVSVRDVSEATRIRVDFIDNMESGNFSFDLPEIYKRGFLRIYAKFLKFNPEEILDEYSSSYPQSRFDDQRHKHLLSRKTAKIAPEIIDHPSRYEEELQEESLEDEKSSADDQTYQYLKIGGVFVGVLLGVVVLVSLISAAMRPSPPKENADIAMANSTANTAGMNADISTAPTKNADREFVFTISALADTYAIVSHEDEKDKPLFTGSLDAGTTKTFKTKKPLIVTVTDINNVKMTRSPVPLSIPSTMKGYFKGRIVYDAKEK